MYNGNTAKKYTDVPNYDAPTYNHTLLTQLMQKHGKSLFDPLDYIFGILTYNDNWCDHPSAWSKNEMIINTSIQIKNFTNHPNYNLQLLVDNISNAQNQTFQQCTPGAPITSITYDASGNAYAPGKEQFNYIPVGPYLILNLVVLQELGVKYTNFSLDKTTFLNDINIQGYDKNNKSYEICNFIIHSGATQISGHYTSLVKKPSGWWYCSDTTVNPISSPTPDASAQERIWNCCFANDNVTTHIFLKLKSKDFFLKQIDQINSNYFKDVPDATPFDPTGLNNLGNTCFFNSMLQCFIHNPYLYHLFTKLCPPKYPPAESTSVAYTPIVYTPLVSTSAVSPPAVSSATVSPPAVSSAAVFTAISAPSPISKVHLQDQFRKIKNGIGGTVSNPIYYTTFHDPTESIANYFQVPTMHQYSMLSPTKNTYAFKLPKENIDNLPPHIKDRRDTNFDDEFFMVIQGINLDMSAYTLDPVGQILFRPHYYYHGNHIDKDDDTNWSSGGDDFQVNYEAGVWDLDNYARSTDLLDYVSNINIAKPLPEINIWTHIHKISPDHPKINLNVMDNNDYNRTLWSFVKGKSSPAVVSGNPITHDRNKKNIITLHWIMDLTQFSKLKSNIDSGAINNLEQLFDRANTDLNLLNKINLNEYNIKLALGI